MAKLILTLDGAYVHEYALTHLKTTIGRKSSNDIHLDNLAISGEHAVVLKQGNDFFVEDLNSTNGTRVNNALAKKQKLNNEDVIELGRFSLTFLEQDVGAGAVFEKTMMVHPSAFNAKSHVASATPAVVKAAPVQQRTRPSLTPNEPASDGSQVQPALIGKIQVLNGTSSGRELVLNKALTTLGKAGVQVAVITKRPNGYFITHVEGKVLPVVNGISTGVQSHALADHDVIELAGVKMEFYLSHA